MESCAQFHHLNLQRKYIKNEDYLAAYTDSHGEIKLIQSIKHI